MSETASISVLHVDDESYFAELAAEMLEREEDRFTVETATSVSEGVDRLAADDFDCIVSDYDMPGQNGIEFLETVRENYPHLPFILFTGKGSEEVASDAISAGITDYLQKGSGTEQYTVLANRIRNAVEKRQSERARQRHLEAIETAHEGISILDEDGRFLYVNEAYADLYGYDPDEMVGEHWELIYPEEEVETARETILPEVKETGFWHGTTTGLRADGSTFREDHRIATTDHGELVCTVRDITERKRREKELNTVARRFEAIFENPMTLIGLLQPDGTLIDANQTAVNLLDRPLDAVTGKPFWETPWWTHSETLQDSLKEWIDRAADGEYVRFEAEHMTADGDTVPVDGLVHPVRDGEGTIQELVAIGRDITERKQKERDLKRERDRYTTLFNNLPTPVVHGRMADGEAIVQAVNSAFEDTFGYESEEIEGERLHDYILPEEETTVESLNQQLLESGELWTELRRTTDDGVRDFRVDITIRNPDAEAPEGYAVYTDITERKEHEDALEELHEATRDLMTATTTEEVATRASETATQVLKVPTNGIHRYDVEADALVPVAWADRTEDLLDGSPPELPVEDSLAGRAYRTGDVQSLADVREADATFDPETPFRSECILPLGEYGVFILSSPTVDTFDAADEALAQVFAANVEAALDHVEQRQQLQRERDRLGEFASIISHDLRNPLNVATARLELAQAECDSDHLDDIARAHDRMDALIDDLLTLAREGERVREPEPVDLADTIDGCWRNVETDEATLVTETEQTIHADPSRLKQLLENLFRNAVEHAGDDVTVTVGELDNGDGFYVADDGPGIPADERDEVFDAGYSTTDESTGFGLNIVQEIAEAHGWKIAVTESETGGARFEIAGVETADE